MDQAFDCFAHKYHNQNEIITFKQHKSLNQWFTVNLEYGGLVIQPCGAPNMVWGIRESDNKLVLVPKCDENQCLFPSMSLPQPFGEKPGNSFALRPMNFPGRAIVKTGIIQEGHGMQQLIRLGELCGEGELSIFFDGDDIHDGDNPYSVMDAWCYETRAVIFFTKESTREHIKFTANTDGTISLNMNPEYVLGTNSGENEIWFVKRDSPYKFIFENLRRSLYPEEYGEEEEE